MQPVLEWLVSNNLLSRNVTLEKRFVVVVFSMANFHELSLLHIINSAHMAKHHVGLDSAYNDQPTRIKAD